MVIIAIAVGLPLILPIAGAGLAVLVVLGCVFVWLLPILLIAASDKTTAGEKIAWILAIVFLSWFAWIFYFFVAPLKGRPERYGYY